MSRSLLTLLLAAGLLVAGCDRSSPDIAQEIAPSSIAGKVDRTLAGAAVPPLQLVDSSGETLDLPGEAGVPVLLNVWATWCAPCVKEMPQLDTLAGRYTGRVAVVAVSQDVQGAAVVEPFFERTGLTRLRPWLDPENQLMDGLSAQALPLTILYDAEGREIWRLTGPFDWTSEEAMTLVNEALPT